MPWKPFPIEIAGDLDAVAGLEGLDRDRLAGLELARASELDEVAVPADARLAKVPQLALRQLPVGDGLERELHGFVAVSAMGPNGDHRARPGLDHGDGLDVAGLLVEDLGHAELPAQDPFHAAASLSRAGSSVRVSGPGEGVWGNREVSRASSIAVVWSIRA